LLFGVPPSGGFESAALKRKPQSGEMFIDKDASSPDSRSKRNAMNFDSSGLGLNEGDGSINMSRLTALGNSSCQHVGLPANFLAREGGEYANSFWEIRSCSSRGSRSSCLGAQGKCAEIRK